VRYGRRLPRSFFERHATLVAPDLLGRILVRGRPPERVVGRIVEVEAYTEDDPASHSFRGRTARNETMFGPPGHLYVYFTYGMHFCSNVVTGRVGEGSAVLLRALEPLEGLERMALRRGTADPRRLCAGPARLAEAFGITRELNGADLVRGDEILLFAGEPTAPARVERTPRVGVRLAIDRRWRFLVRGDPFVSPGRPANFDGVRDSRRS
jgi:DNA-3-methyladenine glycosylase